jgi:hypothetical protein
MAVSGGATGVRGNCPRAPEGGAPKEGGCSQGGGDKYDICPRAPETLAPPLMAVGHISG